MIKIPKTIKENLKSLGFDRTEQQIIFFFLQAKKASSIADIVKVSGLPRSSIHLSVEKLLERNVLSATRIGKRRAIFLEKPERITEFIEYENQLITQKMKKMQQVLPELRSLFSMSGEVEKIDVEFLEGEDGFVEAFYRSLDQKKGGEVLRFSGPTEHFTKARHRLKEYGEQRRKKDIFSRLLLTESPYSEEEIKEARRKKRETRVLPKEIFNPHTHVSIWNNHVCFTVWDNGLHSIIITNKSIYEFIKTLFELAWNQAKR